MQPPGMVRKQPPSKRECFAVLSIVRHGELPLKPQTNGSGIGQGSGYNPLAGIANQPRWKIHEVQLLQNAKRQVSTENETMTVGYNLKKVKKRKRVSWSGRLSTQYAGA